MTTTSKSTEAAWNELCNAIIEQACQDFGMLLSDAPLPSAVSQNYCNISEIRSFAKTQTYVALNLTDILNKIEMNFNAFKEYCSNNEQQIIDDYIKAGLNHIKKLSEVERAKKRKEFPHRCPNCGGPITIAKLRIGRYFACNHCNFNCLILNPEKLIKEKRK